METEFDYELADELELTEEDRMEIPSYPKAIEKRHEEAKLWISSSQNEEPEEDEIQFVMNNWISDEFWRLERYKSFLRRKLGVRENIESSDLRYSLFRDALVMIDQIKIHSSKHEVSKLELQKMLDAHVIKLSKIDFKDMNSEQKKSYFEAVGRNALAVMLGENTILQAINPIQVVDEKVCRSDELQTYEDTEVAVMKVKPSFYLVDGIIVKNGVNLIAGASGSGKSFISLHIGHALKYGKPVFGKYPTEPSNVLLINEENTWSIYKPMCDKVSKGLYVFNQESCFGKLLIATYQNAGFDFDNKKLDTEKLYNTIVRNRIDVVILDVAKRLIAFEENEADKVNKWYQSTVQKFMMDLGLTLVSLQHTKKPDKESMYTDNTEAMKSLVRGSSDFINISDNVVFTRSDDIKDNIKTMFHLKSRISEHKNPKEITMTFGDTNDGEAVCFSCKELSSKADKSENKIKQDAMKIIEFIKENNESGISSKKNSKVSSRKIKDEYGLSNEAFAKARQHLIKQHILLNNTGDSKTPGFEDYDYVFDNEAPELNIFVEANKKEVINADVQSKLGGTK